ncbi:MULTISPECIES: 4'-phosphopantetheinyl transferase superfamily protein [Kitasatospora]|uniref:Putative phosphopantetheinyl transferase n=1 Tax=Kitasatospora setae (strain ATCC 33774 / DSM 43861 / JCM 3304 / KCC A-0304 / NBRC 14216 / KM-6054) TaxID=452652 RepID=E4N2A2_KITSK|nr:MULTISPECIES: 4'-phosphopantetheinyl transferase superfamily protein [Kitasatospora]BAJ32286.1 putative phosphopantetheinyl transferase [Kitasatospora setae KM-6054]
MTDVWLIRTDADLPGAWQLLDEDERARAARHPDGPGRHRFVTAHAAARLLTARAADLPPDRIRWRRGPHGRPEPEGLQGELSVNLSTAGPWALFAVHHLAAGERLGVGVDLEPVPSAPAAARLAARYYPDGETAHDAEEFTRRWTRKEAYTKAHGGRLADGLRTHAGPPAPGPHRLDGPLGPCTVHDLPAPPGYRAAAARTGTGDETGDETGDGTRPYRPRLHPCPVTDLSPQRA